MRLLIHLTVAVLLAPSVALEAQVADPIVPASSGIALDITKPIFKDSDFGAVTSIIRPTAYFTLGDKSSFVVRLPLVYARLDGSTSTTLGNIDFGLSIRDGEGLPAGEISLVVPTAREFGDDDYATGVGILSDILRADRYSSEVWSINGLFTPTRETEGGMMGLRLGGSVWIPKSGGDPEALARYGAYVSKTSGSARFGVELVGMALVSESGLSFNERTTHEVGLSLSLVREGATPEFYLRVPVDEGIRDFLTANLGVRVTF